MRTRPVDIAKIDAAIDRMTADLAAQEPGADEGPAPALRFQRLLVGINGSAESAWALDWAAHIAEAFGSEVHLVCVSEAPPGAGGVGVGPVPVGSAVTAWNRILDEQKAEATRILERAQARLDDRGTSATTEHTMGAPATRLVEIAKRRGSDLLVVGSKGSGAFERFFLGSVSDRIKEDASMSVLIAKGPASVRRILAPVDGSRASRAAALGALSLAWAWGADTTLLHVVGADGEDTTKQGTKVAADDRERTLADAEAANVLVEDDFGMMVAEGDPARTILLHVTASGADLVVMGSRGLSGLRGRLSGSVSNPVAHRVDRSILLYKAQA